MGAPHKTKTGYVLNTNQIFPQRVFDFERRVHVQKDSCVRYVELRHDYFGFLTSNFVHNYQQEENSWSFQN